MEHHAIRLCNISAMKGSSVANARKSLRLMVEQWLALESADAIRVTRFRNGHFRRDCHVCVERLNATGRVAIFYFRHPDGTWRVFPPSLERPTMRCAYTLTTPLDIYCMLP